MAPLKCLPLHITADAACDSWYTSQVCAGRGGIATIPLNQHAHPVYERDADGTPRCPIGLRMHPSYQFQHTKGYRAQRYRCPLLVFTFLSWNSPERSFQALGFLLLREPEAATTV